MILNNIHIAGSDKAVSIMVNEGKIAHIANYDAGESEPGLQLTFADAVIFPGLINSHDHLDFNLFPQFGEQTYNNYTEWGKYIHDAYAPEIASILKIPVLLRERWGVYKNLLCGVTTVINHGEKTQLTDPLITVFEDCQNLHSVRFEKNWRLRLNNPLKKNQPAVIHTGEGTNADAAHEIDELLSYNLLHRKLIGVHGVAMTSRQAQAFDALVWCPVSNFFLLNATADIKELKQKTRILFGTDSTLTGSWNIWDHIRIARETDMLSDDELYQSLTTSPAQTWKLNSGSLTEGHDADLVIAKANNKTGLSAFYNITTDDILLVMHKGCIRMFDESIYHQLTGTVMTGYSKIFTGHHFKYIQGNIQDLINEIKLYNPDVLFPVHMPAKPAA